MEENVQQPTEQRQPRLVYYEPDHDGPELDTIAAVLSLRGYKLTSDEGLFEGGPFGGDATVVARGGDGVLIVQDGDDVHTVPEVGEFPSPAVYAAAIADWLDGDADSIEVEAVSS